MNWGTLARLFDRLYEHSDDIVWIADRELTEICYVTPGIESLIGIDRSAVYANPFRLLESVHPDDRSAYVSYRGRLQGRTASDRRFENPSVEYRVVDATDTIYWLSERAFPIENANGEIGYWGGVAREISDGKDVTETYRLQAEELAVLNQVVRHDIRNEANLGIGILRTAKRSGTFTEEQLTQLEGVFSRVVDLTETARDMTDVIRTLSDDVEPISLRRSLRREVANASTLGTDATVTVDGEIPDVEVNASDILSAVFRNVLKNAIQHNGGEEPTVTVRSHVSGGTVLVHVADDGPGIPDDQKERIFGSGETIAGSEGSGFGLSLVSTLVEQYAGRIYVWDNEPTGSVFTISLPLAAEADA